jgi:hypothetical protein
MLAVLVSLSCGAVAFAEGNDYLQPTEVTVFDGDIIEVPAYDTIPTRAINTTKPVWASYPGDNLVSKIPTGTITGLR